MRIHIYIYIYTHLYIYIYIYIYIYVYINRHVTPHLRREIREVLLRETGCTRSPRTKQPPRLEREAD